MPGRKITNHEDATACLEAVAASGLSRVDWARANGVDARSLQAWRVVIERKLKPPMPLQIVEVVPTDEKPTYVVHVGRIAIEVGENFDDRVLRRILRVV